MTFRFAFLKKQDRAISIIRQANAWRRTVLGSILSILAAGNSALVNGEQPLTVEVTFRIEVPQEKDNDSGRYPPAVFVAGNHPALGNWNPKGLKAEPADDNSYTSTCHLPEGTEIEFKLTRGSWGSVEKRRDGGELPNRRLTVSSQEGQPKQSVLVNVSRWADAQPPKSTVTGELVFHHDFVSQHVARSRTIAVWLPPQYRHSKKHFPVLYLQDGQNLFDAATAAFGNEWRVDETATQLIRSGDIPPIIIVGVWNTRDRIDEYSPTLDARFGRGGKGHAYARFLAEELKPFVDRTYRTKPDRESTSVGGSSLGALVSMQACQLFPDIFSQCAAMSPSLGWDDEVVLRDVQSNPKWIEQTRVWIDMGTREGQSQPTQKASVDRARRLAQRLKAKLTEGEQFLYQEVPEGQHNETAWRVRFADVLRFLYARHDAKGASPSLDEK